MRVAVSGYASRSTSRYEDRTVKSDKWARCAVGPAVSSALRAGGGDAEDSYEAALPTRVTPMQGARAGLRLDEIYGDFSMAAPSPSLPPTFAVSSRCTLDLQARPGSSAVLP